MAERQSCTYIMQCTYVYYIFCNEHIRLVYIFNESMVVQYNVHTVRGTWVFAHL